MTSMPNSFSRFLDEEDLGKVRDAYLESLAALEAEEEVEVKAVGAPPEPQET
ncbi:hypothetical protein ACGFNF_27235 [Micromonospora sp. NPDC048868]|uniref:hypothetical protein n=1 Tax=Micromonospora sp. NPDC048868 TaxID=3364258 RepID=UPI0037159C1B